MRFMRSLAAMPVLLVLLGCHSGYGTADFFT